jgi:hypothetical protein
MILSIFCTPPKKLISMQMLLFSVNMHSSLLGNTGVVLLVSLSLFQPALLSYAEPSDDLTHIPYEEPSLNIAVLLQRWDYMDLLLRIFVTPLYHARIVELEETYELHCNLYILWDSWDTGDVQNNKLQELNIHVAFAPGGVGAWHSPLAYREKLTDYIESGGGFLGACGDAYLGTMGAINGSDDFDRVLNRLFRYDGMTPPLCTAEVLFDLGPFAKHFEAKYTHNNLYVLLFLLTFFISYADVYFPDVFIPFADEYRNHTLRIMESGPPMVASPSTANSIAQGALFIIGTFVDVNSIYDSSLLVGKYAIVASRCGKGRVVLSAVHPEVSLGTPDAHRIFAEIIMWLANLDHSITP